MMLRISAHDERVWAHEHPSIRGYDHHLSTVKTQCIWRAGGVGRSVSWCHHIRSCFRCDTSVCLFLVIRSCLSSFSCPLVFFSLSVRQCLCQSLSLCACLCSIRESDNHVYGRERREELARGVARGLGDVFSNILVTSFPTSVIQVSNQCKGHKRDAVSHGSACKSFVIHESLKTPAIQKVSCVSIYVSTVPAPAITSL